MPEINLLNKYPKSKRLIEERGKRRLSGEGQIEINFENRSNHEVYIEHLLLNKVRQFGKEYFDGDRLYGYGGYYYDSKFWSETVKVFQEYYHLTSHASVLDVGCAKGFMMYDFKKLIPSAKIHGVDISEYAYEHALQEVKSNIQIANAKHLPFQDKYFDLVTSINTVDHLCLEDCKKAILEIQRVGKKSFICVNAWRNEEEKENLLKWNLASLVHMHVEEWEKLFKSIDYQGDYYWFFAN